MNPSNVSNANVRLPGSSPEEAQEVPSRPTGWFGNFVSKSLFAGFGSTGSASDTASELSQGCNIRHREISAAKPQISEQERREVYKKNLIDIDRLLKNLVDEVYSVVQIPLTARCAAEILEEEKQRYDANPAELIKDLSDWNRALKLGLGASYFDSSQTITFEFATQTLKEFRTRLDKLLQIPDLEGRLKSFSLKIAAMLPECETNRIALENPLCLPTAEDKVISTAKQLRGLINDGYDSLAPLLSETSGNKENHNLINELDACIQNILFMQGTKEATITEVQA